MRGVGEHSLRTRTQTQTGGAHQIQIEIAVSASRATAPKHVYATFFFFLHNISFFKYGNIL